MVAPTVNLARTNTVTLANPTPPTNVAVLMQNTPPTPDGTVAAGAAAPDEANKGVFINALNAPTAILPSGRPEGFGTEIHVSGNPRAVMHSANAAYSEWAGPNHPSTNAPVGLTTAASLGTNNTASGGGTVSQAITGTNFTRKSVIYVNGVAQATTFTSATVVTAPTVTKKATAGTWSVFVRTEGYDTAPLTWTFT